MHIGDLEESQYQQKAGGLIAISYLKNRDNIAAKIEEIIIQLLDKINKIATKCKYSTICVLPKIDLIFREKL